MRRKARTMNQLNKVRASNISSSLMVVCSHTLFGCSQTTNTNTIKSILLERCATRSNLNGNIGTLKRMIVERHCIPFLSIEQKEFSSVDMW